MPGRSLDDGKPRRPLVGVGPTVAHHVTGGASPPLRAAACSARGRTPRATSLGLDGLWAAPAPLPLASLLRLATPPRPW